MIRALQIERDYESYLRGPISIEASEINFKSDIRMTCATISIIAQSLLSDWSDIS